MTTKQQQNEAYEAYNKEKIRDIEVNIRDIKKRLTENNFDNFFEKGLLVKQIHMLEGDIKYHKNGMIVY